MPGELLPGIVVSGYGGFYQVRLADGSQVECQGRGKLRQTHSSILTGDRVLISPKLGQIEEILPRKNRLSRPHIANVDQVIIVLAWRLPDYDLLLLDRMLLMCRLSGVEALICFNKMDLLRPGEEERLAAIQAAYAPAGIRLLTVSALKKQGLDQLAEGLIGRCTVLAGPSGVGKSSLLNQILPDENAQVGQVSQRLRRGKHTTRYTRLLPLPTGEGMIADTPGFFVLDTPEAITADQFPSLYPEYERLFRSDQGCRFDGCRHDREPDCAVRQAVAEGRLDGERYQRYRRLLQEIMDREVKY